MLYLWPTPLPGAQCKGFHKKSKQVHARNHWMTRGSKTRTMGLEMLGSGSVASHARPYWVFHSGSVIVTHGVSTWEIYTCLFFQENEWQLGGSELAVMFTVVTDV